MLKQKMCRCDWILFYLMCVELIVRNDGKEIVINNSDNFGLLNLSRNLVQSPSPAATLKSALSPVLNKSFPQPSSSSLNSNMSQSSGNRSSTSQQFNLTDGKITNHPSATYFIKYENVIYKLTTTLATSTVGEHRRIYVTPLGHAQTQENTISGHTSKWQPADGNGERVAIKNSGISESNSYAKTNEINHINKYLAKCMQISNAEHYEQGTTTTTSPAIVLLANKENVNFHQNLQTIDSEEKTIPVNEPNEHIIIRRKRILTANTSGNLNGKMVKNSNTKINYPRIEMKSIYAIDDNQLKRFVNTNFDDIWKMATVASPHSNENSNSHLPPSSSPPSPQQVLKQFPRTTLNIAPSLPDGNHPITTNSISQSLYEPLTFQLANRFSANDDYYQSMRERLFRYSVPMRQPGPSTANGNDDTMGFTSESDNFKVENDTRNNAPGNVGWNDGEIENGYVGADNHDNKDISGLDSRNIRNRYSHYNHHPAAPDPFIQIMLSHYGKYFPRPQFWGLSGYGLYSLAAGNDLHNNLPNNQYKVQEDLDL